MLRRAVLPRGARPAGWGAVAAVLALLPFASLPGAGASIPSDPTCGTPLGDEALAGANAFSAAGPDDEYAAVDAVRMPAAQRSPAVVLQAWGHLVLVAEVKVDQEPYFTWAVMARIHSNTTGWNTTALWLSSPDTSQYYPQGAHIRPSAVLHNDRVWVAWDAQGSTFGTSSERFILLRSFDRNLTADAARIASVSDPNRTVQHPVLVGLGGAMALVYSTSDGDAAPGDTHIVGRTFDGSAFGPTEVVSNLSDSWGDALPAAVADAMGGLHVAWTSANATGESSYVMSTSRGASGWSLPRQLAPLGRTGSAGPAVALYLGKVYIAYSTSNLEDLSGTDSEVRWFVLDPVTSTVAGPTTLNPEPTGGEDAVPTLTVTPGGLAIGWSTTEDAVYSHSSDTDPVYRFFDGQNFGAVAELSAAADNASDGAPSFVSLGEAVYAHWMLTPPQVPGDPRGNSREVVRLVSRPTTWYDNLTLQYEVEAVSDNGSIRVKVNGSQGRPLVVRLQDGSLHALDPATNSVWLPLDPRKPDLEVLACGKPVEATLFEQPEPPVDRPNYLPLIATVVIVALVAVAWVWVGRRKAPPDAPEDDD